MVVEVTSDPLRPATISGGDLSRLFSVRAGSQLNLSHLVLTHGAGTDEGGAMLIDEGSQVHMADVAISSSAVGGLGYGGGLMINGASHVTLERCALSDLTAIGESGAYGGACVVSGGSALVLSDTTITRAVAGGDTLSGGAKGGALALIGGSSLTATNAQISECHAISAGSTYAGAVYAADDSLISMAGCVIMDCVSNSSSSSHTGGFYLSGGNTTLTDCEILRCHAIAAGGTASYGGAVDMAGGYAVFERVTLHECTSQNSAGDVYGGGFSIWFEGHAVLIQSQVTDCHAIYTGSGSSNVYGGLGIVYESFMTLIDTLVSGCTAETQGGGLYASGASTVSISGGSFTGCVAKDAGAIKVRDSSIDVVGTTFSDCHAIASGSPVGGVLESDASTATFTDVHITGCSARNAADSYASAMGGAFYLSGSSKIDLLRVLIADSFARGSTAYGGAMHLQDSSEATMEGCTVSNCSAVGLWNLSSTAKAYGGAVSMSTVSKLTLDATNITSCVASTDTPNGTARGGGVRMQQHSHLVLRASAISHCAARNYYYEEAAAEALTTARRARRVLVAAPPAFGTAAAAAAVQRHRRRLSAAKPPRAEAQEEALNEPALLAAAATAATDRLNPRLPPASAADAAARAAATAVPASAPYTKPDAAPDLLHDQRNRGLSEAGAATPPPPPPEATTFGGAVYCLDSDINFGALSDFSANAADEGGAQYVSGDSLVDYALPAPPGTWLPATLCEVNREACPTAPASLALACAETREECAAIPGRSDLQNPVYAADGTPCQEATFNQPCAWHISPEQIGETVFVLPPGHVEIDFPYSCAPGLLGSAETELQLSPLCAGLCPAGKMCSEARTIAPAPCEEGGYCPPGTSRALPCPEGTYGVGTDLDAEEQCLPCPAGHWCPLRIAIPCEVGYFSDALPAAERTSQSICKPCPSFSTTRQQGMSAISDCICDAGFFIKTADGLVHGEGDCEECPEGTLCITTGLKMLDMPLQRGYWRSTNTSIDVKRCSDYSAQAGSGCVGGPVAGDDACKDSLAGPYCVLCREGAGWYYNANDRACYECTTLTRYVTIITVSLTAIGFALFVGVLMFYCSLPAAKACKPKRRKLRFVWRVLRSLMVKLKIAWGFYQVAVLIPAVYHVKMPSQVADVLSIFSVGIELDAWNIHFSCYALGEIADQISFLMVWPIIGIACTPVIGLLLSLVMKQTTPRKLVEGGLKRGGELYERVLLTYAMPLTMLVLFVAFPPVTALAFRTFEKCEEFSDEVHPPQRYLVSAAKHYVVPCPSAQLDEAQEIAWGAILLYPVGVIVLCAYLLWVARAELLLMGEETIGSSYSRSISFLHASFVPAYFYFDVLELVKKLLLIGFASLVAPGSLEQIMIAVLISLLFLILHLQSSPYKNALDNILATMVHLMMVIFFLWCTLIQSGALGDPQDSGSLSHSGTWISIMMLISVVGVLVIAVMLFLLEVFVRAQRDIAEARQRAKWAGCTVDPPTTNWPGLKGYACFLSHFKAEAASDARLMHDMLAKMLKYPIFLDSAKLVDLRKLITNGVEDCDVMMVLATKGYVSRPWCLLECVFAERRKVPIVVVNLKNGDFQANDALNYIANIEEVMGAANPDGLALLRENLGDDLTELKQTMKKVLTDYTTQSTQLSWNANASDSELLASPRASLKDIIEGMALVCGSTIKWKGGEKGTTAPQMGKRGSTFSMKKRGPVDEAAPALHIICNCDEALQNARVLQTEIAIKRGRLVTTTTPPSEGEKQELGLGADTVAILLTKNVLHDPAALVSAYAAILRGKTLVPVCLIGHGYDYKAAGEHLHNLAKSLGPKRLEEVSVLLQDATATAPDDPIVTVEEMQAGLCQTLPRIIAVNWEPSAGKNQLDATVDNVMNRVNAALALGAIKLKTSAKVVPMTRMGSALYKAMPSPDALARRASAGKEDGGSRTAGAAYEDRLPAVPVEAMKPLSNLMAGDGGDGAVEVSAGGSAGPDTVETMAPPADEMPITSPRAAQPAQSAA